MGCLISNGITRSCDWAIGGIKSSIWLANAEDFTALYASTGQVTGATVATGATFYEFQQEPQSASLTQSLAVGTLFVAQTATFALAGLTQAKIQTLNTLALSQVMVIAKANDGNYYWIGDNGSSLKPAVEVTTGVADADAANAVITLTGSNKGFAPVVAVSALAALGIS